MIRRPAGRAGTFVPLLWGLLLGACAGSRTGSPAVPAPAPAPAEPAAVAVRVPPHPRPLPPPVIAPDIAFRKGWMPLAPTGVDRFRQAHPEWDGRGVLIAILDSGIDPGVAGLVRTSTGDPKLLDLRDFSGEGHIALTRVAPRGDTLELAGHALAGFARVRTLDQDGPWYAGFLAELPLGDTTAADVNANGSTTDSLPIVVARATDGWILLVDTDGDGSLAGEKPVHDYLVAHETFGWTTTNEPPRLVLAANFREEGGEPALDLHFDTSGHGTHVAGIAAGHDMYGVPGFDGVAPGALLLSCKIADDAQGGVTTTGSMIRALEYAVRFAASRGLPLVVNLSFGVSNELEGTARIDTLVDSVLAAHPDVVMTSSAGNEGPGLSTVGFPASASRVIAVGALFPGVFLAEDGASPPVDALADFSSRGGEVAGPHIVAPGLAYSTVPRWHRGEEREGGTSMASPHAAGLAALLLSASSRSGFRPTARTIRQALMATAQPLLGAAAVDDGAGLADVTRAWAWLARRPEMPVLESRSLAKGEVNAALLVLDRGIADSVRRFAIRRVGTGAPLALRFRSTAEWLVAPKVTTVDDSAELQLSVRPGALRRPGVYSAVVSGWLPDTLLGAAVRIPVTVIVPHRGDFTRDRVVVPARGWRRVPIVAEAGRPFSVQVSGTDASMALAYLHEPGGRAYRSEPMLPVGSDDKAALFEVEASEVQPGVYELVVQGSPFAPTEVSIAVRQSPVRIALGSEGGVPVARVASMSGAEVSLQAVGMLLGGMRRETVRGRGGAPVRLPVDVPPWARLLQVEVQMAPADWSAFTDFGLTLFDPTGHQLQVEPLESSLGRLELELGPGVTLEHAVLGFFPAFADPGSRADWSLDVTLRFFADSSQRLEPRGSDVRHISPEHADSIMFDMPTATFPMPSTLQPFGVVALQSGEDVWAAQGVLVSGGAK